MSRSRAAGASLLLAAVLGLVGLVGGFAVKAPCLESVHPASGQAYLNWTQYRQYKDYCYTDVIPLYGLERLSQGGFPYKTAWTYPGDDRTRYMEYPVLTGMLQYGAMRVTKSWLHLIGQAADPDPPEVVVYFVVMALVLAVAWLLALLATAPLVSRPGDIVLMALSPLLVVHAFTNFDTLAVALACGGILAWARGRPVLSGVLLGLGAAAKLYPLFVLGPLFVLCRRDGRLAEWRQALYGGLAGWLLVNLPIAWVYPRGWWEFFRLNSVRPAEFDSVYNAISTLTGWQGFDGPLYEGQSPRILNLVSLGLFALACLVIGWVGATAPVPPRLASLTFLVIAAFLLTNKVWSPQYSLWLVPLGVLALPRVLPLLVWMSVDAALWFPRMRFFLNLGEPGQGTSAHTYAYVVLARDAAVLMICALIVRTIYRPDTDTYRTRLAAAPDVTPAGRRWR